MCSVAFVSMASTGFFLYSRSLNNDAIPFDSDVPNAAAYGSTSALLLAMIFCSHVYAFPGMTSKHHHDFRVSWQPAQSESVNVVTSSTMIPYLKI